MGWLVGSGGGRSGGLGFGRSAAGLVLACGLCHTPLALLEGMVPFVSPALPLCTSFTHAVCVTEAFVSVAFDKFGTLSVVPIRVQGLKLGLIPVAKL